MLNGHDDPNYVVGSNEAYDNLTDSNGDVLSLVDAFCKGYAEAMLWVNTYVDNDHPEYMEADGGMVDALYWYQSPGDWFVDIGIDYSDAIDFLSVNLDILKSIPANDRTSNYGVWDCHGHDFALTRNGHGAGFWDRGYGEVGDTLSDAARVYGEHNLYVDADDKIWNE